MRLSTNAVCTPPLWHVISPFASASSPRPPLQLLACLHPSTAAQGRYLHRLISGHLREHRGLHHPHRDLCDLRDLHDLHDLPLYKRLLSDGRFEHREHREHRDHRDERLFCLVATTSNLRCQPSRNVSACETWRIPASAWRYQHRLHRGISA